MGPHWKLEKRELEKGNNNALDVHEVLSHLSLHAIVGPTLIAKIETKSGIKISQAMVLQDIAITCGVHHSSKITTHISYFEKFPKWYRTLPTSQN